MTIEELRKIGLVQLSIMDEVHKICEEEKITYYMIAGTLLGAVRHKGFIPWDLDIDIGMPREDYERFKMVCERRLKYPYKYLDYTNCPVFFRPHALITRMDTKIEIKYDHVNPKLLDLGIYIDVFPLDNAPDDSKTRAKHADKLKKIRKWKDRRIPYSYSYNRWKRYVHYAVSTLLGWVSIRRINQQQQNQMQKYRNENTKCLCSMGSQYAYEKQCMSRGIYGKPTLLEFEGRRYFAPEKYLDYLTHLYGDYMSLPPEEKRQVNLAIFTSVTFPEEMQKD
jgi:lipopolysaccharide cholinephosphotransferase